VDIGGVVIARFSQDALDGSIVFVIVIVCGVEFIRRILCSIDNLPRLIVPVAELEGKWLPRLVDVGGGIRSMQGVDGGEF